MMLNLNKIKHRITSIASELREDAAYAGERDDRGAARLEWELSMFVAGFKACQDAVIFEINHVVDAETEIEVPKQWEKYFEKEQKEYQEYLRLKAKFEKDSSDVRTMSKLIESNKKFDEQNSSKKDNRDSYEGGFDSNTWLSTNS